MSTTQEPLLVDMFCGMGGTAEGMRIALGHGPSISINHNEHAIKIHSLNHPETQHQCGDVFASRPHLVAQGRPVGILTASPDCRHFSRAKGSPKVSPRVRMLAHSVIPWIKLPVQQRPRLIVVENVSEFTTWGPLTRKIDEKTGETYWTPNPAKKGTYFRKWIREIQEAGYDVDWRMMRSCDFGAPTSRNRLFVVASLNGPVEWPEPTHGHGTSKPWHTAAECIDWSQPMTSIFDRPKPLAEATQRRICAGFVRYVLGIGAKASPKIGAWVERMHSTSRGENLQRPLSAITAKSNHHALCVAIDQQSSGASAVRPLEAPLSTVTTKARHGLVRVDHDPAWIAKNYTGVVGHQLEMPLGTVTTRDHHSLCVAKRAWTMTNTTGHAPGSLEAPLPTITSSGNQGLCAAATGNQDYERVIRWVERYYSSGGHSSGLELPLPTIRTKACMSLIEVRIREMQIVDILFRMFQPHELLLAMGFRPDYILTGTKEQQIERIGNAVTPQVPAAIIKANWKE